MNKLILIAALVWIAIAIGYACPPPRHEKPLFEYDPNMVNYRLFISDSVMEGNRYTCQITACDPDEDSLVFSLLNGPEGLTVDPNGFLDWPNPVAGVYYIDIQVEDIPPDGNSLTDEGTFVLRVYERPAGGCVGQ